MRAIRSLWSRVTEPRHVTIAYLIAYLAVCVLAVWALTEPPLSLLGELGPIITAGIAVLLLAGGVLASAATVPGWWALERIGIALMVLSLCSYIVALIYMHATEPGSRALQIAGLSVGVLLSAARAVSIWGRDWAPRGGRIHDSA